MFSSIPFAPLGPNEFFRNQHLTLLLRDKVGKFMLLSLREDLLRLNRKNAVRRPKRTCLFRSMIYSA